MNKNLQRGKNEPVKIFYFLIVNTFFLESDSETSTTTSRVPPGLEKRILRRAKRATDRNIVATAQRGTRKKILHTFVLLYVHKNLYTYL